MNIHLIVRHLTPRQRYIIAHRFGLDGAEETCQEIAESIGRSKNRVQQMEMHALRKLKRQELYDLLDRTAPSSRKPRHYGAGRTTPAAIPARPTPASPQ